MSASPGAGRSTLPLAFSLLVCAASAFWVADGVAPWNADRSNVWHHYEYLTEGFLSGHTYLSLEPAPELSSLKDPYDPAANARYRLWDASLYQGKYYLYYGPAPAVALMLPWRAVTGHMLPQRLAVAVFAAAGTAGLGLLLSSVRRKHFPGLSGAALGAILLVAFHAAWLPVILRRPGVWELPIVSAVASLWWALFFLWKFHDSGGKARWAVAVGIALALLMGSRATFVLAAIAVAGLALASPDGPLLQAGRRMRSGLAAAGVAFAGGAALLIYNHERFGRWMEFGQSYQLWGMDERHVAHFSLSYAPFNAWTYLFSTPSFGPYFPFLHPYWTSSFPNGYIAFEEVYGVLFMMPVHLAGFAALAWAWRSRHEAAAGPARLLLSGALAASVLSFLFLACWAGACSRYITELMGGWTVLTALGLLVVFGSQGACRPGRMVRLLVVASACWTVACVWLASAEFRGFMRQTNPVAYRRAAHALDYPSAWWAAREGIPYGPVDLDVRVPPFPSSGTVLLGSGRPQRTNQLILDSLADGKVRLTLADNQHPVLVTPELSPTDRTLHLRIDAPWLYPPAESPYWDALEISAGHPDPRRLFSIGWDAGGTSQQSSLSNDPTSFRPTVRAAPDTEPGSAYVASMKPIFPPR